MQNFAATYSRKLYCKNTSKLIFVGCSCVPKPFILYINRDADKICMCFSWTKINENAPKSFVYVSAEFVLFGRMKKIKKKCSHRGKM